MPDEFDYDCYKWAIENVRLDFLVNAESFYQKDREDREKPLHSHVYYELLFSAEDGSAEFLYEKKRVTLAKNAFVITAPYYSHRTVIHRRDNLFSFGFLYQTNSRKEPFKQDLYRLFSAAFSEIDCIVGVGDETLARFCRQLKEYSAGQDAVSVGSMASSFLLVLFHILKLLRGGALSVVKKENEKNRAHSTRIPSDIASKINNILSDSFMTDVTPEELSAQYYISAKQINRYIYNQYGQTFMQRRTQLRMLYAEKLLLGGDLSIGEISEKVGYRSINSFYSAFKVFFGVTPQQYRLGERKN